MKTPIGAYVFTPHKTIDELVAMAKARALTGENYHHIIQDIVDGYNLGWFSANYFLIETAAKSQLQGNP